MESRVKILRSDDIVSPGEYILIPLGWDLDEVKNAAFKLVFPGNGNAPEECTLQTIEGVEIDDVSLIYVLPESTLVVHPGNDFEDAAQKVKEKKGAFSLLKNTLKRDRNKEKEKEKEKEEKEEKEQDKEKDKEKEKKDHKRNSFFDSIRKAKAPDFNDKDAHLPDWLRLQKRIFTRFVNQKFRMENSKTRVDDLTQDCKDGVVLIELLEIMSGKPFPDKKPKSVKGRIKQIDNCAALLGYAKNNCGITTDCSAENIVDGEEKPLMSFIFQIILKYMKLDDDTDEDADKMDVRQALIVWLRNRLQPYNLEVDEKSFCKTVQDGMVFCALLHKMRPRLIPFNDLIKEQKIKNLTLALEVAEQYAGVQQYLEPSDISKLDELGMTVYLSDWYHGVSFMELQNAGARRIAKLVEMTRLHDSMKVEYETRAKDLVNWINSKIKEIDIYNFDNTLDGIQDKKTQFYQYKSQEKGGKITEHMEIEAIFEDLSLRLTNNSRPHFNPPHGLTITEIRAKLRELETSENNRALAIQKELERQLRLDKTAARFEVEYVKLINWIEQKQIYLDSREISSSVAQVLKNLNVLTSHDNEWKSVKSTQFESLAKISKVLDDDNYIAKDETNQKTRIVDNKMNALLPKYESKLKDLNADLEHEKKKEKLRLDYAAACSDFLIYANDQINACGIFYFGDKLKDVEDYEKTLTQIENEISMIIKIKKDVALSLYQSLSELFVTDINYTQVTPTEINELSTKYSNASSARRQAYTNELQKQRHDDSLCRSYAQKMEEFVSWIKEKKLKVNEQNLEVEPKLAIVLEELEKSAPEAEGFFSHLEKLDKEIKEAGVAFNDYAKTTTSEARTQFVQYLDFLNKVKSILEAEIHRRKTRGLTQAERDEIVENFKYFDADGSGFLERREFRTCLQSLGYDASPTAIHNFMELYDKDKDGLISLEEFTDLMLKRLEDTDSKEEIVEAFTVINQKHYARVDHLNAVVHEIIFPQEHVDYLLKEMEPQEDGYNFEKWSEQVFSR